MKDKKSKEEELFQRYVDELLRSGLLLEANYEPISFALSNKESMPCQEQLATKVKDRSIHLLNKHEYTPDWKLRWSDAGIKYFTWQAGSINRFNKSHRPINPFYCDYDGISWIDVKGGVKQAFIGSSNSSAITFPLNQKWMYQVHDIYVQKTVVSLKEEGIFYKTFTPQMVIANERYQKNTKHGKKGDSKLKYVPVSLEEYCDER